MFYFAFFLEETGFVEKCLILLKHVGNTHSKSVPHITLRVVDKDKSTLGYLREEKITYLNIVEPGSFNFDDTNSNYVVFLKCESEDLEEIDYRPRFPFSRLHITLYEGRDYDYASYLYNALNSIRWGIELSFSNSPLYLEKNMLGSKVDKHPNYTRIAQEIFGDDTYDESLLIANPEKVRIQYVDKIIDELNKYIEDKKNKVRRIESYLQDDLDSQRKNSWMKNSHQQYVDPDEKFFVTPPECAKDMSICAIEAFKGKRFIRFGDSSVGTGNLFLTLKRHVEKHNLLSPSHEKLYIESAIGIDIDPRMAIEAYKRFSKRDLKVVCGDAVDPTLDIGSPRNLMLVNPPYNRTESISSSAITEYKSYLQKMAKSQTGIDVSARAGLFVYHMLIMDKWLAKYGIGVWLIPRGFLDVNYGIAVRKYLTSNVQLLRLHIYDEKIDYFDNTMVTPAIVVFKKIQPNATEEVTITYGKSIEATEFTLKIPTGDLIDSLDNWNNLIFHSSKVLPLQKTNGVLFSELFEIKRGIATGANDFFVIERKRASELGIPEFALRPVLPKSRYLSSRTIEVLDDGFPDVSPQLVLIDCSLSEEQIKDSYPAFYNYLQEAKVPNDKGKRVVDGYLVKSRSPWYKQEERETPMFLLTYMGRPKKDLPPLYFVYNKSEAVALNTYILLYPKKWLLDLLAGNDVLCEKLLNCLNNEYASSLFQDSRVYSGGLRKLEPRELQKAKIYKLPKEIIDAYRRNQ